MTPAYLSFSDIERYQMYRSSYLDTVDALVSQIKWLCLVGDMLIQSCINELLDRTMTFRHTQLKHVIMG